MLEGTDNDRGDVIYDKITYRYGDSITVSAAPDLNWKFKEWDNGSTQNPYKITLNQEMVNAVTADSLRMDLMVRWAPDDGFVNVEILAGDGGDVSISKNREGTGYKEGDIITINAISYRHFAPLAPMHPKIRTYIFFSSPPLFSLSSNFF